MEDFSEIIVSSPTRRVPTASSAPGRLGQPFLTSQSTRLISIRLEVASLYAALLSHQQDWPCGLPPAQVPFGLGLRRF